MMRYFILNLFSLLVLSGLLLGEQNMTPDQLWKHVVTVDRLAWKERSQEKNIHTLTKDEHFVRRIYLDITGKVPTYDQMFKFLKDQDIGKRKKLIDRLLETPGYISNYSVFFQELLRNPAKDPEGNRHKEFTRFIERFLYENRPYDQFVKELILAEGHVQTNHAVGFYLRDYETNVMDTLNATVRAFLGTRIGCAQCHNHRFDKWTQKDFYETAAHFQGAKPDLIKRIQNEEGTSYREHYDIVMEKLGKPKMSYYSRRVFYPSNGVVRFNKDEVLKYPQNYAYDNASPNAPVKERIVFGYGSQMVEGENKRERFANWVASKDNPMFSRIMANRLWQRIMGVALVAPIDDWKDNIEIQNKELFDALGDIFVDLNFNIKNFLKVIYNSEAYQYAIDLKQPIYQDNYKVQGARYKRMLAHQLNDSLLVFKYGSLDDYSRLHGDYFEFEDQINELAEQYIVEFKANYKRKQKGINSKLLSIMEKYYHKIVELETYFGMGSNGYFKNAKQPKGVVINEDESKNMMASQPQKGSSMQNANSRRIRPASHELNELQYIFGGSDRSGPETESNTEANLKQVLKMMNSKNCKEAVHRTSYLMKEAMKRKTIKERVSYLYYSIFGRAPSEKDMSIAVDFFIESEKVDRWSKYALALINSPEFFYIK